VRFRSALYGYEQKRASLTAVFTRAASWRVDTRPPQRDDLISGTMATFSGKLI